MKKINKRVRRVGAGRPRRAGAIAAFSLAHQMADEVGAVGDDREELVYAALYVGQWLADVGIAGRWDQLVVAELYATLGEDDAVARGRFLFSLAGLVGFAGLAGHLAPAAARRVLLEIAGVAEDPILHNYARRSARSFRPGALTDKTATIRVADA